MEWSISKGSYSGRTALQFVFTTTQITIISRYVRYLRGLTASLPFLISK